MAGENVEGSVFIPQCPKKFTNPKTKYTRKRRITLMSWHARIPPVKKIAGACVAFTFESYNWVGWKETEHQESNVKNTPKFIIFLNTRLLLQGWGGYRGQLNKHMCGRMEEARPLTIPEWRENEWGYHCVTPAPLFICPWSRWANKPAKMFGPLKFADIFPMVWWGGRWDWVGIE